MRIEDDFLSYIRRRTTVDATTGCWNWNSKGSGKDGRPIFTFNGRSALAYRTLWEKIHNTKLSKKDFVCHSCDNPRCCNIEHLFLSDAAGNNEDAVKKGRNFARKNREGNLAALKKGLEIRKANPWMIPRGEQHCRRRHPELIQRGDHHWTKRHPELIRRGSRVHNAMFTDEQVAKIRSDNRICRLIAEEYGCHLATINYIKRGKHYST